MNLSQTPLTTTVSISSTTIHAPFVSVPIHQSLFLKLLQNHHFHLNLKIINIYQLQSLQILSFQLLNQFLLLLHQKSLFKIHHLHLFMKILHHHLHIQLLFPVQNLNLWISMTRIRMLLVYFNISCHLLLITLKKRVLKMLIPQL